MKILAFLRTVWKWVMNVAGIMKPVMDSVAKIITQSRNMTSGLFNDGVENLKQLEPSIGGEPRNIGVSLPAGAFAALAKYRQQQEMLEQEKKWKKEISDYSNSNEKEFKRINLQISIVELVVFTQTTERFTNNLSIHTSNLIIHFNSIKNQALMFKKTYDVHSKINEIIKCQKIEEQVPLFNDTDDETFLKETYKAFQDTKVLLLHEIDSYIESLDNNKKLLNKIKENAREVPEQFERIKKWIENTVETKFQKGRDEMIALKAHLEALPEEKELEGKNIDALPDVIN